MRRGFPRLPARRTTRDSTTHLRFRLHAVRKNNLEICIFNTRNSVLHFVIGGFRAIPKTHLDSSVLFAKATPEAFNLAPAPIHISQLLATLKE